MSNFLFRKSKQNQRTLICSYWMSQRNPFLWQRYLSYLENFLFLFRLVSSAISEITWKATVLLAFQRASPQMTFAGSAIWNTRTCLTSMVFLQRKGGLSVNTTVSVTISSQIWMLKTLVGCANVASLIAWNLSIALTASPLTQCTIGLKSRQRMMLSQLFCVL